MDHGKGGGREKFGQGVEVRGDTSDKAADGIAVVITHRQAMQVRKNSGAHVVHGLLADALHDTDLDVLGEEVENKNQQITDADEYDTAPCAALRQGTFEGG